MRILPGRLYQFSGRIHAVVWDGDYANYHGQVVHRLRAGDVILVISHLRERQTTGDWWMQVSCAGLLGYVKTSRVRKHLTEVNA